MAVSEILLNLVYPDVTEGQQFFVHVGEVSVPVSMYSVTYYRSFLPVLNSEAFIAFIQGIKHILHIHMV